MEATGITCFTKIYFITYTVPFFGPINNIILGPNTIAVTATEVIPTIKSAFLS